MTGTGSRPILSAIRMSSTSCEARWPCRCATSCRVALGGSPPPSAAPRAMRRPGSRGTSGPWSRSAGTTARSEGPPPAAPQGPGSGGRGGGASTGGPRPGTPAGSAGPSTRPPARSPAGPLPTGSAPWWMPVLPPAGPQARRAELRLPALRAGRAPRPGRGRQHRRPGTRRRDHPPGRQGAGITHRRAARHLPGALECGCESSGSPVIGHATPPSQRGVTARRRECSGCGYG